MARFHATGHYSFELIPTFFILCLMLAFATGNDSTTVVLSLDRSGYMASRCIFDTVSRWTNHTRIHYPHVVLTGKKLSLQQALSSKPLILTGIQGVEEYCYHWDKFYIKRRCPEPKCPCNVVTGSDGDCASLGARDQCITTLQQAEAKVVLIFRKPALAVAENYLGRRLDGAPVRDESIETLIENLLQQGAAPKSLQLEVFRLLQNQKSTVRYHQSKLTREGGMLLELLRSIRPMFSMARQYAYHLRDTNGNVVAVQFEDLVKSRAQSLTKLLHDLNFRLPQKHLQAVLSEAGHCLPSSYSSSSKPSNTERDTSYIRRASSFFGRRHPVDHPRRLNETEVASLADALFEQAGVKDILCKLTELFGYADERCV